MLKTFGFSFRIRNTYRTNSIIWALKGIPLVKGLLPASLYSSRGLKTFADIVSGAGELLSVFLGKALYLAAVFALSSTMNAPRADSFIHILVFTTVIGGILNTHIFDPSRDKFYAIFLMRMDARLYTLTDYFCFLLKMLVGFTPFILLFGRLAGADTAACLAFPAYVICVKLCFTAFNLRSCKKVKTTPNENKPKALEWAAVAALLAAAAVPYTGYALPQAAVWILSAVLVIPAAAAFRYIWRFDAYRSVYKDLLKAENFAANSGVNAVSAAQQLAMQKNISSDIGQTSDKSGYKYFNELFMKRHSKLLTRSAKRIAVVCAVLFAGAAAGLRLLPEIRDEVNNVLMTSLPYFLFVMYMINRGGTITQAMFMNCDHSMLTYRFYRQPKAILTLFVERLKYVVLINLLPAAVIGLGLPLLLYASGGTTAPLNYAVLFVSVIAMSVLFSVHSLVLYYLLQPYNVNLESKSAVYGIMNALTYMASWFAIKVKLPTLWFGSAMTAFCAVYIVAAFMLAYKLAPRTFKLRN